MSNRADRPSAASASQPHPICTHESKSWKTCFAAAAVLLPSCRRAAAATHIRPGYRQRKTVHRPLAARAPRSGPGPAHSRNNNVHYSAIARTKNTIKLQSCECKRACSVLWHAAAEAAAAARPGKGSVYPRTNYAHPEPRTRAKCMVLFVCMCRIMHYIISMCIYSTFLHTRDARDRASEPSRRSIRHPRRRCCDVWMCGPHSTVICRLLKQLLLPEIAPSVRAAKTRVQHLSHASTYIVVAVRIMHYRLCIMRWPGQHPCAIVCAGKQASERARARALTVRHHYTWADARCTCSGTSACTCEIMSNAFSILYILRGKR